MVGETPLYLINPITWTDAIGSTVFLFEGIGVILPIYDVTADKKRFPTVFTVQFVSVAIVELSFSLFCVFSWKSKIASPLITDLLPAGAIVWIIKAAYAVVLIIMSELLLFPAHLAIESYFFGSWEKSKKR